VAILPHLDGGPIYNAVNFDHSIYTYANNTVHAVRLDTLACPSDGSTGRTQVYPDGYLDVPPGQFVIAYSNYAACSGTWHHFTYDLAKLPTLAAQDNGVAFANSSVRFADVTDGLSQTFLFGERAHGRLGDDAAIVWHWWFDGYRADTLFWTLLPINAHRVLTAHDAATAAETPLAAAAGSEHPGGAHFAMADGSVRFIKESVDSWPIDGATGGPIGVSGSSLTPYVVDPDVRLGVYQALSTRSGREVIPPLD